MSKKGLSMQHIPNLSDIRTLHLGNSALPHIASHIESWFIACASAMSGTEEGGR